MDGEHACACARELQGGGPAVKTRESQSDCDECSHLLLSSGVIGLPGHSWAPAHCACELPLRTALLLYHPELALLRVAVPFPTLPATWESIQVLSILFFVDKHFRTGFILSTAFAHLFQGAFKALLDPVANKTWEVGHWACLTACVPSFMLGDVFGTSLTPSCTV